MYVCAHVRACVSECVKASECASYNLAVHCHELGFQAGACYFSTHRTHVFSYLYE